MAIRNALSVSVCIPTYKRANLVADAIASALNQSLKPKEILIFDNCSNDGIKQVVQQFESSIVKFRTHSRNIGMCGNWNACLNAATGDVLTLLHSDDWYADQYALERAVDGFARNENASIVYSVSATVACAEREQSVYVTYAQGLAAARHVYEMGQLPCSSTFYRTNIVRRTSGFSDCYSTCCDEEFNSRMALLGDVVRCSTPFAVYRRHSAHVMYDMWVRPEFLSQYLASNLAMAANAGVDPDVAKTEAHAKLVRILRASSWMAFRHGRLTAARAIHRCIMKLKPSEYLRAQNMLPFMLHHIPLGHLIWRATRAAKQGIKIILRLDSSDQRVA